MMASLLGALLGWLAGSVLRIRRAQVEAAMRAAGVDDAPAQARAMYRSLGVSLVEFLGLMFERSHPPLHARNPTPQPPPHPWGAGARAPADASGHAAPWSAA